jgi:uncharacterized membrane protein YfcA
MLLGGLPGVVIGAIIIIAVPNRVAELALGMLAASLGVYSLFKPALGQAFEPRHADPIGLAMEGIGMFAIGILNGPLSWGTGLFATLWRSGWHSLDCSRAAGIRS